MVGTRRLNRPLPWQAPADLNLQQPAGTGWGHRSTYKDALETRILGQDLGYIQNEVAELTSRSGLPTL